MDQLRIVFFKNKPLFKFLSRIFTGCKYHHIGFIKNGYLYDMNWMRRRVEWEPEKFGAHYIMDAPVDIPEHYFYNKILNNNPSYGFADYFLFLVRPILKRFRIIPHNKDGIICSEMVNDDLVLHGWHSPFRSRKAPPSPCDIYVALQRNKYNNT